MPAVRVSTWVLIKTHQNITFACTCTDVIKEKVTLQQRKDRKTAFTLVSVREANWGTFLWEKATDH